MRFFFALLFLLTQISAQAAVLDFSGSLSVTASSAGGIVTYSVTDQGQVRGGSDPGVAIFDFSNSDGMVAWHDSSTVSMRFYDPGRTNWVSLNLNTGNPQNLRNANGVVAWMGERSQFQYTAHMAAYDQVRGRWVTNSEGPIDKAVYNLATANGVVAWSRTFSPTLTRIYYRIYDPIRGVWTPGFIDVSTGSVLLHVADGIVAWRSFVGSTTTTYYLTYDPVLGVWKTGSKAVFAAAGTDPVTSPGVVAWSLTSGNSSAIYYRAFDPTRGEWREGESAANSPFNLSVVNGTVSWTEGSQTRTRGYRVLPNSNWNNNNDSSTLPYADFVASTNAGNPPLPIYFIDMSMGTGFMRWDFGDGETTSQRSPLHRFRTFAKTIVTLTVSGSTTSHMASIVITNDISAPIGTVLINGGDSFTTNPIVNLSLSATDNSGVVTEMRLSNANDQSWTVWEPYVTNRMWTLSNGVGPRTVYAQFRDGVGNLSAITNDTIMLDTTALPLAFFNPATSSHVEENASATIDVFLSMPFTREVTVAYATANGTALADSDYTDAMGILTFAAGQTNQTFLLGIREDGEVELNETLMLSLTVVSNAVAGPQLTFTILDDDPPAVSFVSSSITAGEGGGAVTVAVALTAPSGRTIYVNYATTTNGTAIPDQDYQPASGLLVFGPGQTNQSFSVMITNDTLDELSETVQLVLFGPTNAVLGAATGTVTILDDDPPSARFSNASYSKTEGPISSPVSVQVWLTKPYSQPVGVDWEIVGGTATAGADYPDNVFGGSLVFLANETNKMFQITIRPDTEAEGDETIELRLTGFSGVSAGSLTAATITIVDDDVPPRIVGSPTLESGVFSINVTGAIGQRFAVQVSTNLPQWMHWRTFTNVTGSTLITDLVNTNFPGPRFYRTVFPAP